VLWSVLNLGSKVSRYIIGSLVSAILYFLLISDFAVRHSYYHMPFLPMFCLGIATPLSEGISLIDVKKIRYLKYAALALVIVFAAPFVKYNIDKQFDIQILGSDVAGRYIRKHGEPADRIFISYGSPSDGKLDAWRTLYYGTLWEAGKRGNLLPADLELIRFGEKERNMRWLLLYETKWLDRDKAILDHIYGNYSIRQIGYRDGEVLYYLLRFGGAFDPAEFETRKSKLARTYEFSHGGIEVFVKEL
jgi:hypothetical protein